jgi:BirA family biotin operon repressor/biotin-[acetyl-CoA-carboxylase] ligase
MDQQTLEAALADLHLPAIRYYPSLGSTNDEAWKWMESNAPDLALVIADEQTAGRGRTNHRWFTTPGAGLAFSLIFLPPTVDPLYISRLTGLGAIAVQKALARQYALPASIKWPNDILINDLKLAGVLVETRWSGDTLAAAVIGIGINIAPESVSEENLPKNGLNFPAACVETMLGRPIDRLECLHVILGELLVRLPELPHPQFIREWEAGLAYLGQWVELSPGNGFAPAQNELIPQVAKVNGLAWDGSLELITGSGTVITARVGELQLRPLPSGHLALPCN